MADTFKLNPFTGRLDNVGSGGSMSIGGAVGSGTSGSILFIDASGNLGQDNSNLFWDETNKSLGISSSSPSHKSEIGYGHQNSLLVTAPTGCTAALAGAGAGNLNNGDYYYRITFVTPYGETEIGGSSGGTSSNKITVVDNTTNGQVQLTNIPIADSKYGVTSRKIYRTKTADTPKDYGYYLLYTLNDNSTTTYLDNTADSSLGSQSFSDNSTAGKLYINGTQALFLGKSRITSIGYDALSSASLTGGDCTAFGITALKNLTSGGSNQAFGTGALFNCLTGTQSNAFGYHALYTGTTPYNCSAFGHNALWKATGNTHTGMGANVLFNTTSGASSTAFGAYAGYSLSTNGGGVFLGYAAGYYETGANKLFIDNATRSNEADGRVKALVYGVFASTTANQLLTINGNLGVLMAPSYALDVTGGGRISAGFGCNGATPQTAYASGGAVSTTAGAFGFGSDAERASLTTLVSNIRAALVANGIMS